MAKHFYTNVSDLVLDIEAATPVHTKQGKVEKVTINDVDSTFPSYVNLAIDRFGNFFSKVFRNFEHNLAEFQSVAFRYNFERIHTFINILEKGNEHDYDVLVANAALHPGEAEDLELQDLIEFSEGLVNDRFEIKWIEPDKDPVTFWDLVSVTYLNHVKSQWALDGATTFSSSNGTFNRGMIESITATGERVNFIMNAGFAVVKQYYFSVDVALTVDPVALVDGDNTQALATNIGTDKYGFNLYKMETFSQGFVNLNIGNDVADTTPFKVRFFDDNPNALLF